MDSPFQTFTVGLEASSTTAHSRNAFLIEYMYIKDFPIIMRTLLYLSEE